MRLIITRLYNELAKENDENIEPDKDYFVRFPESLVDEFTECMVSRNTEYRLSTRKRNIRLHFETNSSNSTLDLTKADYVSGGSRDGEEREIKFVDKENYYHYTTLLNMHHIVTSRYILNKQNEVGGTCVYGTYVTDAHPEANIEFIRLSRFDFEPRHSHKLESYIKLPKKSVLEYVAGMGKSVIQSTSQLQTLTRHYGSPRSYVVPTNSPLIGIDLDKIPGWNSSARVALAVQVKKISLPHNLSQINLRSKCRLNQSTQTNCLL